MRIKSVDIENFRLLRQVAVGLEERTTLVVGRNNSGKTSIAELFRRLLSEKSLAFRLEDFSLGCHEEFWVAFEAFQAGQLVPDVVALLPSIKVSIDITYDVDSPDLGPLSDCIVDLDPDCTDARLILTYGPGPTAPALLFGGVAVGDDVPVNRLNLFRAVSVGLSGAYGASLEAVDPNDPTNRKALEPKTLTTLIRGGFINAQRGLDDDTHRERDVLGKVVEVLFQSALTDPVDPEKRSTAEQLKAAVEQIQGDLHAGFNAKLTSLLPTFDLFGYPGLSDPGLVTETSWGRNKVCSKSCAKLERTLNITRRGGFFWQAARA